jgi:hypothetical protein
MNVLVDLRGESAVEEVYMAYVPGRCKIEARDKISAGAKSNDYSSTTNQTHLKQINTRIGTANCAAFCGENRDPVGI